MMLSIKKILPSLCTLANLVFGLISLVLIIDGQFGWAAVFIVVGMFFDGFDGRLARALNVSSEFGKQLDSLSDLVTFGVAPAILAYSTVLRSLPGHWGLVLLMPFPMAGALRLARFNLVTDKTQGYYIGMPITMAGGFFALALLYWEYLSPWMVVALMFALAWLMVSTIHYPDFKKVGLSRAKVLFILAIFIGAIITLRWHASAVFMFPMAIYALVGIKNNLVGFWHKKIKDKIQINRLKFKKPRVK